MSRQLVLDLPVRPALGRENFLVAPSNALAVRAVEDAAQWPGGKLALIGAAGAGKTHLAHVWAAETGATIIAARNLAGADIDRLARQGHVAVEDAEALCGDATAERALFHLHNHLLGMDGRLLITARTPPARWPIALPDLASRMQATQTATIEPPDDTLLAAVLVKLFADRQIAVQPELIAYLLRRMERSLAAAARLVAALDARALAEQRPVSRSLAAQVLDSPDP
ncbi:DnaA ATPase domain-containing protein [Alkalilacustris brevis]|uniref:DnaA ATPase domain-containing protein n=1 Tax=Alkalilacustris brevis TaxID=2026338 RepID=UPI000E0D5B52|nr:DnaA/Hda family protein [Alkalilacustris brevis]